MTMPAEDRSALLRGEHSPDWGGWIEYFEREQRENEPVYMSAHNAQTPRLYVDIQPTHNTQHITGMTEEEYRAMWRRSLIKVAASIALLCLVAAITN